MIKRKAIAPTSHRSSAPVALALAALAASAASATVTVSNVAFTQDAATHDVTVTYNLATSDGEPAFVSLDVITNGVSVGATRVKRVTGNVSTTPADTASLVWPGTDKHSITWKARADLPNVGLTDAAVRVTAIATNHFEGLYMVVDLSRGKDSAYWPVQYTACKPDTNSPAFYATELWLRRVPAGTFTMGDDTTNYKPAHQVTLSKDFYCAVLPMTVPQQRVIYGSLNSAITGEIAGDRYPAGYIKYTNVRDANWPTNNNVSAWTSVGRIRKRTGLQFDLPTEAQWEYVCRGGHSGHVLGDGSELTQANVYAMAWTKNNSGNAVQPIGVKKPNSWDFHDMTGTLHEWCRDFATSGNGYTSSASETDPKGPMTNAEGKRVRRGSSFGGGWGDCNPWFRLLSGDQGTTANNVTGYRLVVETDEGSAADPALGVQRGSGDSAAGFLETRPAAMLAGIRSGTEVVADSFIDTATALSFVIVIR
ncbi:MAG: SUMF1/EgtB/PvdO family nonheme iron enzyme [Kiritimatiellae bacterium]|nr:SUMF1/EgtB/PvdO family nonheme iron enzyme [Kiritimatiellia bacterium]